MIFCDQERAANGPTGSEGADNLMEAPRDFEALKRRLIEIELLKRLRQTAAFALEHPDEVEACTCARSATPEAMPSATSSGCSSAKAAVCRRRLGSPNSISSAGASAPQSPAGPPSIIGAFRPVGPLAARS